MISLHNRLVVINLLVIAVMMLINIPAFAATLEAPSNLISVSIQGDSVLLQWNDNSETETGFVIQRRLDNTQYVNIATLPARTRQYSDSGLSSGTNYHYRVKATSATGESDFSNELKITTLNIPKAPSYLVATYTKQRVILVWTDNSGDETGFQIERKIDNGSYSLIASAGRDMTYYKDDTITYGNNYYYRVKAYNANGSSGYSNEANAGGSGVPGSPTELQAQIFNGSVQLTWRDNSLNEKKFVVERSDDKTTFTQLAETQPNVTILSDTLVSAGKKYYYRVKAVNAYGSSSYSDQADVTTPPATGGSVTTTPVPAVKPLDTITPLLVPAQITIKLTVGKKTAYCNGTRVDLSSAPQIRQGKLFVPAKDIVRILGSVANWDKKAQKMTITIKGKTIQIWAGRTKALVNGRSIYMDQSNKNLRPFVSSSGSLMVPVGFLNVNLGIQSTWNSKTSEVSMIYTK
ncbi:MAG: stalk domain-containing protein [Acidobacteriota bacterium]